LPYLSSGSFKAAINVDLQFIRRISECMRLLDAAFAVGRNIQKMYFNTYKKQFKKINIMIVF